MQSLSGTGLGSAQLSNSFLQRSRPSTPSGDAGRGGAGGWPPISALPSAGTAGQPSSTLLEQMARRVLLSSGGQGGAPRGSQGGAAGSPGGTRSWSPPSNVKDHPEAQALASVYPELAAQIQLLSQQLQAVQAQLAMVMPSSDDSGGGAGGGSAGAAPSIVGGREPHFGGPPASPGRATPAPPAPRQPPPMFASSGSQASAPKPAPASSGGAFSAEDLLRAFAAGMQKSQGSSMSGRGGATGVEDQPRMSKGPDPPSTRRTPPPAEQAPATQDLPPAAWNMLQALLKQPGSPGRSGGCSLPVKLEPGASSASAIEQLSAALRAAGDKGMGTVGRGGGASDHGSAPIGDMFAFLASVGQGGGRRGV